MLINYCIYYLVTHLVDLIVEVYSASLTPIRLQEDEYLEVGAWSVQSWSLYRVYLTL